MHETIRQAQLNEATRKLLNKLDMTSMPRNMGCLEWDIRSGVISWDQVWAGICGFPKGVFKGNAGDWEKIIHHEDLWIVLDNLNEHFAGGI